jgi:hypothetical protein
MYSLDGIAPIKQAMQYSLPAYKADGIEITWWAGHDNDGYVTLQLKSDSLQEEHNRLKQLGCKPTFDEYKPHVTILTPIQFESEAKQKEFIRLGNLMLRKRPLELVFDGQKIENCNQN